MRNPRARTCVRRLAFALVASIASLVPRVEAAGDDHPIEVRVQLHGPHQFRFAGFYAAIERGFFRRAGLTVRLREGGRAVNPTDVVVSGHAEFGVGTSRLIVSRSRGRPIVAVAAIFQHSPYVLLARDDPSIRSVRDLADRRVMVEPFAEELIAYLHHEGADVDRIVEMPHGGDPLALDGGEIAAMSAYAPGEPFILDRAGVRYRTFDPKLAGIDFYGDTVFTSEAYAGANEAVVAAFRRALIEGWRYALQHRDEVLELIRSEYGSGLRPEDERLAADLIRRLLVPDLIAIGEMNPDRWEHIASEFAAAGLLDGPVDLDAFLFEPAPADRPTAPVDLAPLFAAGLVGLISLALLKLYRLNQRLRAEVDARRVLEAELKELVVTDVVTGVLNRRGVFEALERCAAVDPTAGDRPHDSPARPALAEAALAILILDLDHFKHVNDTYGHAAGDHVLTEFARLCLAALRPSDLLGRMGGEEFAVLLPGADIETAREIAGRIREALHRARIRLPNGGDIGITASIGVAARQRGEALDALMCRADGAMYEAKCLGRNRVVVAASADQTGRLKLQRERLRLLRTEDLTPRPS